MKLIIERSSISEDCETCGTSFGEGVRVSLDDKIILDIEAFAGCFESSYVEDIDILKALCKELKIELEEI